MVRADITKGKGRGSMRLILEIFVEGKRVRECPKLRWLDVMESDIYMKLADVSEEDTNRIDLSVQLSSWGLR